MYIQPIFCESKQKKHIMRENVKIELEYVFKTSTKALENLITTPNGLAEWFSDEVKVDDDVYTFVWGKSEESARLLFNRKNTHIRWRWLHHEEDGDEACFFEFQYETDPLTNDIIFKVIAVSDADTDEEDLKLLWENGINDLRRVLGT